MSLLNKAAALLARATHRNTPTEEARTTAVLLARLIVDRGLEIHEAGVADELRAVRVELASLRASAGQDAAAQFADSLRITSKLTQSCKACGDDVDEGARCQWVRGHGVFHLRCWQRQRRAA
ncbi:MAG: hypothetical protein HS104_14390 [Polyangiaceae bacterium]|nr:hypothetical protein [Polyangiaceae bacterium]MCL4748900.1 hypothetical protein [Myxococcales bacterium]